MPCQSIPVHHSNSGSGSTRNVHVLPELLWCTGILGQMGNGGNDSTCNVRILPELLWCNRDTLTEGYCGTCSLWAACQSCDVTVAQGYYGFL